MLEQLVQPLLQGSIVTLQVFFGTLLFSLPLAIIAASIQNMGNKVINLVFKVFVMIERGTPLLLQMMFVFFGLPYMGIVLDRTTSIFVAFILNYMAYFMEIVRGGIQSVDVGQKEACQVLGYSEASAYVRVILPQALQNCLPSIGNEVLTLVKDTSLITVLGASELLKAGRTAVNTYGTAIPFIYVGVIYLLMTMCAAWVMGRIEKSMDPSMKGE
ncbi:MAG: amino acid ABC transporter permease [Erysipelotrichaceae bacterium]|nr:amino acid ABC transporter permease [Erysipelotrichaceae bacterium]MBR3694345.1 amino acid ABC transporter permease [Erysipelotrichales bacterium]